MITKYEEIYTNLKNNAYLTSFLDLINDIKNHRLIPIKSDTKYFETIDLISIDGDEFNNKAIYRFTELGMGFKKYFKKNYS